MTSTTPLYSRTRCVGLRKLWREPGLNRAWRPRNVISVQKPGDEEVAMNVHPDNLKPRRPSLRKVVPDYQKKSWLSS